MKYFFPFIFLKKKELFIFGMTVILYTEKLSVLQQVPLQLSNGKDLYVRPST